MGNSKSSKVLKEPEKFFERERWKEQQRKELLKPGKKNEKTRTNVIGSETGSASPSKESPQALQSYDEEALRRMRYQLSYDSEAFLLNNVLLAVQFFENYEKEIENIRKNIITEDERKIDESMLQHHKHVFIPDRMQERVQSHVSFHKNDDTLEPLIPRRLYVIYDNVEAKDPGDTSDYSAVLDAPFYKLCIENSKEPGYVQLKKIEVLENSYTKDEKNMNDHKTDGLNDTNDESDDSTDCGFENTGEELLQKIKKKINTNEKPYKNTKQKRSTYNPNNFENDKENLAFSKNILSVTEKYRNNNSMFIIKENVGINKVTSKVIHVGKKEGSKKSKHKKILKENMRETSGYGSTSSNFENESSETESDYGYSTITEAATLQRIKLSTQSTIFQSSGVLPEQCWVAVISQAIDDSSEDETDNEIKLNEPRILYQQHHYLNSTAFMVNFVDEFLMKLSVGLGFDQESLKNALSQGASIYCHIIKHYKKFTWELSPAILTSWPNTANRWIIRERRIIQNPRTNFSYQWPTKYMVHKAVSSGCLLLPVGFRQKRGVNPDQKIQWKVVFPSAERYLDSNLSHSHARCYLFTILLYKTFMERETCRLGVDVSHIKNHFYWQCEANYARWPEDRLGETLRIFLKSFYTHLCQARLPNYFIENCNEFKNIPKPILLQFQRKLADILEAPVMHILYALEKLNYVNKDFYPQLNYKKLYNILTCKNPLQMLNPNLSMVKANVEQNIQDYDENETPNFWTRSKSQDKYYQWKKEKQRQLQEWKKIGKKEISLSKLSAINKNMVLPKRMDVGRRRLVLEFFIPHFIAMARGSELFDATKQSIIYLEQAQRLCFLLREEPAGDTLANDYLNTIHKKLSICQQHLARQTSESYDTHFQKRSQENNIIQNNDKTKFTPTPDLPEKVFIYADIHKQQIMRDTNSLKTNDDVEESKL